MELFDGIDEEEVRLIPIAHTDGGCITYNGKRQAAIGVYWGPSSTVTLSQMATEAPFTNQKAELEASLHALQQAMKREIIHLIVVSESLYAVTCLIAHSEHWVYGKAVDGSDMLLDAKGRVIQNNGLFLRIFDLCEKKPEQVRVFFRHVKRSQNMEADLLVNEAFPRNLNWKC